MLTQGEWTGWKSGRDKAVMELALTPDDLGKRYGLTITRQTDSQLGPFFATHFFDAILGPVAILAYDQSPTHTATVFVDATSDEGSAIARLSKILALGASDIVGTAATSHHPSFLQNAALRLRGLVLGSVRTTKERERA